MGCSWYGRRCIVLPPGRKAAVEQKAGCGAKHCQGKQGFSFHGEGSFSYRMVSLYRKCQKMTTLPRENGGRGAKNSAQFVYTQVFSCTRNGYSL